MARDLSHRAGRSRAGRLPYAFVGVIVLAAMVILTSYYEFAVNWSNGNQSYNVPEQLASAFQLAQEDLSAAAYQDLMRAEAALLVAGADPQLDLLNGSVGQLFSGVGGSLQTLNFTTAQGFVVGSVVVHALSWGINVSWDEGQVYDGVSQVSLASDANDPNLPLASVPDSSRAYEQGVTEVPAYPMVVGWVALTAYDESTGVSGSQTVSFTQVVQSELGLLQDSAQEFAAGASGPQADFSQLVSYLVTTLGELRALSAYGSGGWLGPNSATVVSDAACTAGVNPPATSILSCDDIHDAVSLAEILMSLQYFHDYDPGATNTFLASLPSGAYQTLLQTYVTSGTVDGAALYLLLLYNNGGWFDDEIATGSGLAAAIDSFADRYTYDLLDQFFGNQTVDPTLTEPVVDWTQVDSLNFANLSGLLYKWLNSYQNWLGISVTSLPGSDVTAVIPTESSTVAGCTYTILPAGSIQVTTNPIPNIADLLLGSNYAPQTNNGVTLPVDLPELLYNVWENVSVDTADLNGDFWTEAVVGDTEQAGYLFVDKSFLNEYDQSGACTPGGNPNGCSGSPLQTLPYLDAVNALITTTTSAMEQKPAGAPVDPSTDVIHTGYVNYLADNGSKDGNNYTAVQAGLPDLSTAAGVNEVLNSSSYSLLTNGSNSILQGPYQLALQHFATQATNSSWLNASFLNGADHPNLLGANASGPGGAAEGTYPYAMTDIARLTAREWFQVLYGLWYGSAGDIPVTIPSWDAGKISYNWMDSANYHVESNGVEHNAPPAYHEPDFAINVMNETYISVLDWMGWDGVGQRVNECGGIFGNCGDTGALNEGAFATGACGGGNEAAAYAAAKATWYSDEGAGPGFADNTWTNVRTAVLAALTGTPGNPGADQIHSMLTSSWWAIKNNTGDGYFTSENFTNWTIRTFAAPIINDTRELGQMGGWLSQLFASADQEIWQGANQTSVISKPYVENQVAYSLWQGNRSAEGADQQLFNESLRPLSSGINLTGCPEPAIPSCTGTTLSFSAPATTIHLVDPQDDASNMGISAFSSTWSIRIDGSINLNLTSTRPVLSENGYLYPTDVNFTIPLDVNVPVTIYTPWELSSGWDPDHNPLPGDPAQVQTRGLLGLEGNDYRTAIGGSVILSHSYDFMPGMYVSPTLDSLFSDSVSIGKVISSGSLVTADMLAALPDRDVGASAAWAQNLTLLENLTNTALVQTGVPPHVGLSYAQVTQGEMTWLNYALTRPYLHNGPFNDQTFTDPGYFGSAATLDAPTDQLNIYSSTNLPASALHPCTTLPSAGSCFGDPLQYNMTFAAPQVSVSYFVNNDFNAYPFDQGFTGTWDNAGGFTFASYWREFNTPYELQLKGGPGVAGVTPAVSSSNYPGLAVPYWGPAYSEPATLSTFGVGGLPLEATQAFAAALAGYLPSPGVFSNYVAEEQYQAGLLYDAAPTGAPTAGVTQFGYSTSLEVSAVAGMLREENFSVALQDAGVAGGIFNAAPTQLEAFLLWYVANHDQIAYGLGDSSVDPTVLASAEPYLMQSVYRNMTLATGDPSTPSTFAYLSCNLAASEADLGGTGGGLLSSPTVLLGGGTPGTWEMDGSLTTG